jgi:hypothetical protein
MLGRIFRVLSGFVLACLVAGLTQVLFAFLPTEALSDLDLLPRVMPIATHIAIFSAPFALVAIATAEWQQLRDWVFYVFAAMAIALIGFFAQYNSETDGQGWSILESNYPLIAFLVTGLASGFAYWASAGRFAGSGGEAERRIVVDRNGNQRRT